MSTLSFIDINGRRYRWRDVLTARREQLAQREASRKAEQPALFELRDDCRPTTERTAAQRFQEPSLFA